MYFIQLIRSCTKPRIVTQIIVGESPDITIRAKTEFLQSCAGIDTTNDPWSFRREERGWNCPLWKKAESIKPFMCMFLYLGQVWADWRRTVDIWYDKMVHWKLLS
jgi:hypothetical protein